MHINELIAAARLRGATVHLTADYTGWPAVVQVLGLPRMTTWPLPLNAAERELTAALK